MLNAVLDARAKHYLASSIHAEMAQRLWRETISPAVSKSARMQAKRKAAEAADRPTDTVLPDPVLNFQSGPEHDAVNGSRRTAVTIRAVSSPDFLVDVDRMENEHPGLMRKKIYAGLAKLREYESRAIIDHDIHPLELPGTWMNDALEAAEFLSHGGKNLFWALEAKSVELRHQSMLEKERAKDELRKTYDQTRAVRLDATLRWHAFAEKTRAAELAANKALTAWIHQHGGVLPTGVKTVTDVYPRVTMSETTRSAIGKTSLMYMHPCASLGDTQHYDRYTYEVIAPDTAYFDTPVDEAASLWQPRDVAPGYTMSSLPYSSSVLKMLAEHDKAEWSRR